MKENLVIKKFKKESVNGTFNLLEEETFFGTKVMEIEDDIIIDDKSIQYFQYWLDADINNQIEIDLAKNNGYQYHDFNDFQEQFYIMDVVNLKLNKHTISKQQQSTIDEKNNTRWSIEIDIRNILREYLFAKIKERRSFKSIPYYNFKNKDINSSIYEYIDLNLLDRFKFTYIDFYIKYTDIKNNTIYNNITLKKFDPKFNSDIEDDIYKNTNVNVQIDNFTDPIARLQISYNQSKSSDQYKFDYYFNIHYKKI